jgi:hypothetical protein
MTLFCKKITKSYVKYGQITYFYSNYVEVSHLSLRAFPGLLYGINEKQNKKQDEDRGTRMKNKKEILALIDYIKWGFFLRLKDETAPAEKESSYVDLLNILEKVYNMHGITKGNL